MGFNSGFKGLTTRYKNNTTKTLLSIRRYKILKFPMSNSILQWQFVIQ